MQTSRYARALEALRAAPRRWLVTGAAGFIGSNLMEHLLRHGQHVVGLDNLATGHRRNLDEVLAALPEAASRFRFVEGDIRDRELCARACEGVDFVLHQAALGSVPRSIDNPAATHESNVDGFFNVLLAARETGVARFVYAASSSTYGDHPGLPKVEERIGRLLSPYAVTKYVNELYADIFRRTYGVPTVGLRYFNVFGPRQDPEGAYAAVIPRWVASLLAGESCQINGDGSTSRDFCYVDNVVQANVLAATTDITGDEPAVFNVAYGEQTTLNELFAMIRDGLAAHRPDVAAAEPHYAAFRAGDIQHSLADTSRIRSLLGYQPEVSVHEGIDRALRWYADDVSQRLAVRS